MHRVVFYLAFVVAGRDKMVVAFENLKPRLHILIKIYRCEVEPVLAAASCLFCSLLPSFRPAARSEGAALRISSQYAALSIDAHAFVMKLFREQSAGARDHEAFSKGFSWWDLHRVWCVMSVLEQTSESTFDVLLISPDG